MKNSRNQGFTPIVTALFVVLSVFVVFGLSKATGLLRSNAAAPTAQINFVPGAPIFTSTTATQNVTVNVNVGTNKVGFAKVTVLFDKSKLALSGEATPTNTLKTVVSQTKMAEANATGQIELSLGLSKDDRPNAPTGVIPVVVIPFKSISTKVNDASTLSIDEANTQIVDMLPQNYALTVVTSPVTFNPQATPTPTVTPTKTPSPTPVPTVTPTKTPSPTLVPTIAPTKTPIATIVPTKTPSPTPAPTVTPTKTPTPTVVPTLTPRTPAPTSTPISGPVTTKQVTLTLASSSDIANVESGLVKTDGIYLGSGKVASQSYLGMKFSGQSLPAGAKIVSATIAFSPLTDQWVPVTFKIGALKTGNISALTSTSNLSLTSTVRYSDNVKWLVKSMYNYDVTAPINELFSTTSSPSSIALVAQGDGAAYSKKLIVTSGTYAPTLKITYTSTTNTSGTSIFDSFKNFFSNLFR